MAASTKGRCEWVFMCCSKSSASKSSKNTELLFSFVFSYSSYTETAAKVSLHQLSEKIRNIFTHTYKHTHKHTHMMELKTAKRC